MDTPIVEKLRKLIAHEKSARSIGNLHEAEAFAAKIQSLLTEHKLGMSDVEFEDRETAEPIGFEPVDSNEISGRGKSAQTYWRLQVGAAIAKVNGCEMLGDPNTSRIVYFIGRTSDRELAKIVYIYLIELGEELCFRDALDQRDNQMQKFRETNSRIEDFMMAFPRVKKGWAGWMKNYRESWRFGYGAAIAARLEERYAEMMAAHHQAGAIVHIKKDALAIKDFLKDKRGEKTTVSANPHNNDGLNAGLKTGGTVNLAPHRFDGARGRASKLLGGADD